MRKATGAWRRAHELCRGSALAVGACTTGPDLAFVFTTELYFSYAAGFATEGLVRRRTASIQRQLVVVHASSLGGCRTGTSRRCLEPSAGLDRILAPEGNRPRDLVLAMIVGRIIAPTSKLATTKALNPDSLLELGAVRYAEPYGRSTGCSRVRRRSSRNRRRSRIFCVKPRSVRTRPSCALARSTNWNRNFCANARLISTWRCTSMSGSPRRGGS